MPAPGVRQAHTEGDKQQSLGRCAGLRISFSGFSIGPEMGSEREAPVQVHQISCGVFLALLRRRAERPSQAESKIPGSPKLKTQPAIPELRDVHINKNSWSRSSSEHFPPADPPQAPRGPAALPTQAASGASRAAAPLLQARPQSLWMCLLPSKAAPP